MKQAELGLEQNFTTNAGKHKSCDYQLKENEIFLGNTTRGIPEDLKHLKTIRLGKQAYSITGNPLDTGRYRPLIINKSEEKMYELVHKKRMKNASRKYL